MARSAAILGVYLLGHEAGQTRVGVLTRDREGRTAFVVDEVWLRDPHRPVLSLAWQVPHDDGQTQARLASRGDKIGLHGLLPPWFAGLLPEGALRELVMAEMGPGDHDQFDLILRLGADLPGAVLVVPETALPASAGPLQLATVEGFQAPWPDGNVKFSLAGVQLKFAICEAYDRLTIPARAGEARFILKVASDRFPGLPEAEYAGMRLAALVGIETARCRLIETDKVDAVPAEFLRHGATALMVERFDRRADGGRIHIEDAGQIVGAIGERKYTMATTEMILNMIRRFSTDWRADVLEGMRRIVVDVLVGNGDNHLKNWSFIFPVPGVVRLSPAYDIVPTVLYAPDDRLALKFAGTHDFANVTYRRFRRVAAFLDLDPDWIEREMKAVVRKALDLWPSAAAQMLDERRAHMLIERLQTLALVKDLDASLP